MDFIQFRKFMASIRPSSDKYEDTFRDSDDDKIRRIWKYSDNQRKWIIVDKFPV